MAIEVSDLKEEELASLVKDIIKNPDKYSEEAKFILVIDTYNTQGALVNCWKDYDIILGDAKEVLLEKSSEPGPPSHYETKYAIVPLSKPVVIRVQEKRYVERSEDSYSESLYIFTGEKWVRVDVK